MSVKYHYKKIHIKPEDYIAKFMDWDDQSPCYVLNYIEPYGRFENNEMSDTIYGKDDFIPYHDHKRGLEVFLVDSGSAECHIRGMRAVATKGDMIIITPFVPHGFRILEDDTIWREHFQEVQMNEGILQLNRIKEYYPETAKDEDFLDSLADREGTEFFKWMPALRDVDKSQVSQIRPYDFAINRFDFEGLSFLQKVTRLEANGNKEIWQIRANKGIKLSWNERNSNTSLFVVYSGSVRVDIDGMDAFDANERDILHIPSNLAGSIEMNEDAVLIDYNCIGYLYRALEEIDSLKETDRAAYEDNSVRDRILNKQDYFIRWE